MKRLFFTLIVLSIITAPFSRVVYAEVTQFVFTTEPQIVGVGISSDTITIQSQNSSGLSEDITETTDIIFTSTSATGQFLSTSGNPVSTTMSRNTTNKNFLYKDGTAGTYTITITATGRTSLNTFTANQQIVVGENSSQTSNSTSTEESEIITSTPTPIPVVVNSAHSSPVPLSDTENKMEFEVYAGRTRLVMVGSSIFFIATPTKLQNIAERSISYEWSFGDGTTEKGLIVSHSYNFPGEYSVVLNAHASDKQAVSRTLVRVVSPVFVLSRVSGGVEILNKSGFEVNLENWNLSGGGKSFIFPKDTIISSGNTIIFADNVTGITGDDIKITNPKGKLFGEIQSVLSTSTQTNQMDLMSIQNKITEIKAEIAKINPEPKVSNVTVKQVKNIPVKNDVQQDKISNGSDQLANVIEIFKAPERQGVISSIFSWPIKGIDFIKSLFIEE